jgi:hypothetical protein
MKVSGIDNDWLRVVFSKIRGFGRKNLNFERKNIFETDLSDADIVYLYLPQNLMTDLEAKLQRELKSGAVAMTLNVSLPAWPTEKIMEIKSANLKTKKLFVYAKI